MQKRLIVLLYLWATACGDNIGVTPEPDAGPDNEDHARVFAVAGNFAGAGVASTIGIPSLQVGANVIAGVASQDPYVRYIDGIIYIINSFGSDNIVRIDAADLAFIDQISTGAGTSPQDVAVKQDILYVAALNAPGIVVIDTGNPGNEPDMIDLSSFDESDGIPDCTSIYRVDDRLFVTCSLLQNFAPVGPGKVVVIDTTDNSVIDSFDLQNPNPFGFIQPTPAGSALGGDLLIATVTFPELTVGCLERIGTGATPASGGCAIDNATLGGFANSYAYAPDDTIYLAVTEGYNPGPISAVRVYDAATGELSAEPMTPAGQSIFDLVRCPTGELILADAAAGGIRVYSDSGMELTQQVLDIGLPPVSKGLGCFATASP